MRTPDKQSNRRVRFGIRAQIAFLSLGLISIPLLGLNYWNDARNSALIAQARIQQIEAKAIATTLLATQQNIRELLAGDDNSAIQKHALSAPSIQQPMRLDGRFGEWPQQDGVDGKRLLLGNIYDQPVWLARPDDELESQFSLYLAQSPEYLFVGIDVLDNKVTMRRKNHLRLDYNDTIRMTFQDQNNQAQRIIIPAEREGSMASYFTDAEWEFGIDQINADQKITPSHRTGVQGFWRLTDQGYAVEFRIPKDSFYGLQPQIHFAVVDVDERPSYGPQAILATLPEKFKNQLNPVALHARELQRVIDKLKNTYARLWIYDSRGREWAFAERESLPYNARNRLASPRTTRGFDSQCVKDALLGQVDPLANLNQETGFNNYQDPVQQLVVCYPITEGQEVLGVVVIEESADVVLQKEEQRIQTIGLKFGAALIMLLVILFIYAFTLVRRISRLSDETQRSIDSYGRIENTLIQASHTFPDEIGDLSRNISSLLEKQQSYTGFLERVPQTLRHEIANPLNKLRTSLENLLDLQPELAENKYLNKIDAGIDQITRITLHLTEAASLESAIQNEALYPIEMGGFLSGYLSNWEDQIEIENIPDEPCWIMGEASRLEQLMDKLLENACSFCPPSGRVSFRHTFDSDYLNIMFENDGPPLPSETPTELFSPMISTRSSGSSIHLGLGLHIAKLICDHHGATIKGENRNDRRGVLFTIRFKKIEPPKG